MNLEGYKLSQKKIIFYVIIIALICVVGVSYAFFTAGMSAETTTTVQADAGTMKITYSGGNNINLSGIYPRDEVWATKAITVTGNNTTDAEMYYKLTLIIDSNTFPTSDPLQYELVSTNTSTNGGAIPSISKTDITSSTYELGNGHFIKANSAKHTYQLKIYYPNKTTSQNDNQGATFSAHVEIESIKAPTVLNLSNLIKSIETSTPITTPGAAVSLSSEALLASVEDDYGMSYYFRGAVKNNYVEFANKCWRIVRITGKGSVKLVLHNDNTSGTSNPCSASNNGTTAAFAHYSTSTYTSAFNSNYNDNAYIGFMYGTTDAGDYTNTHTNTNKSTILNNLETWYSNNLATYSNKIADTAWCADKTNIIDTTYDPLSWNSNGLGYAKNITYYGATQRLVSSSNHAGGTGPNLKCNGELSSITNKIGLLSADEIAFAGYAMGITNSDVYLQENATGTNWWSISPGFFSGSRARVWFVNGIDGGFDYGFVNYTYGIRPSISLASLVTVTGSGTSEDPYIIN